jgi:sortase B
LTKLQKKKLSLCLILFSIILLVLTVFLMFKFGKTVSELKNEQNITSEIQVQKKKSKLKSLKKKYPDMVGWVEIKKSPLSYPVMQTGITGHHKDDWQYYLHRDVKGNYSFSGVPFLDVRCNLNSDNIIIYGHNINGNRCFGFLQNFRSEDFFKKHKKIYFTRVNGIEEEYKVVSVIETDKFSDYYAFTDTGNYEDYREAVLNLLKGSKFINNLNRKLTKEISLQYYENVSTCKKCVSNFISPSFRKYRFLTLSTCRTMDGHDKRLLVIGVRER